ARVLQEGCGGGEEAADLAADVLDASDDVAEDPAVLHQLPACGLPQGEGARPVAGVGGDDELGPLTAALADDRGGLVEDAGRRRDGAALGEQRQFLEFRQPGHPTEDLVPGLYDALVPNGVEDKVDRILRGLLDFVPGL